MRPDTTRSATSAQKREIARLREAQKQDSVALDMRYNWETPFLISSFNPRVFYMAGNRVLKSMDRGDDLYPISPDLTTMDTAKIHVGLETTGGITNDATGAENYCTIVSLAESYLKPGWLYAGTDDGNVWMTHNDGATWEKLNGRFPGVPAGTYVSRIEPSYVGRQHVLRGVRQPPEQRLRRLPLRDHTTGGRPSAPSRATCPPAGPTSCT